MPFVQSLVVNACRTLTRPYGERMGKMDSIKIEVEGAAQQTLLHHSC